MKVGIAALTAGIIGAIGIILFLVAFGTEYWLLATETCESFDTNNGTLDTEDEVNRNQMYSLENMGFQTFPIKEICALKY